MIYTKIKPVLLINMKNTTFFTKKQIIQFSSVFKLKLVEINV